jgi:hypothetical protein
MNVIAGITATFDAHDRLTGPRATHRRIGHPLIEAALTSSR